MSVAVVDTGTAVYDSSNIATQTFTFTVSSGATLAVFFLCQDSELNITSVTWDNGGTNQACQLIGSKALNSISSNGSVSAYAVVNPTVGTSKTLSVVQGASGAISAELQSYSGTVTTSVAAACTNFLSAAGNVGSGTSNVGTAAQSGSSGDMYVSAYGDAGSVNSLSDTSIYLLSPTGLDAAANRFPSTGSSHSLTANVGAGNWAAISFDIVAASASLTLGTQTLVMM